MIRLVRRAYELIDRPARTRFSIFAVLSVVVAGLEALAISLVIPLADLLLAGSEPVGIPWVARAVDGFVDVSTKEEAAAVLGMVVAVAFIVKVLAAVALLRWAIGNALGQEARISRQLFASYLLAPSSFHAVRTSAEIQRTLNESLPLVFRRTLPFVLGSTADMFTLAAIVIVILVSDPIVATVAVVYFVAIGYAYQRLISRRQLAAARQAHHEVAVRYRQVQDAIRATEEIAVLNRQRHFIVGFYQTKLELVAAQRLLVFYQLLPRYFLDLAFVVGGGITAATAFALFGLEEGLATVGLFLAASFRLAAPLNRIISTATMARAAGPSLDQVLDDFRVFDGLATPYRDSDVSVGRLGPVKVELAGVQFRYSQHELDVVRGIDIVIEPGEDIGIVGATGSGKTTLLKLLLGLIEPTGGEVIVAGRPLRRCRTDWQLSIGYVPQEIVLIDDTIVANVAFGIDRAEVDRARVERVLELTQLTDFVRTLPCGIDTVMGELGSRLSGGQRQRIGMARALYHKPNVLVLDEATAAVDSSTEARILAALESLPASVTVITVSHRVTTLRHCDRIYFLRDGEISAAGPFDVLNAQEPDFAQLVALAQPTPAPARNGPSSRSAPQTN